MKLQPTAGPNTAHTTLASRWSLVSSSATTAAPATSAATITAPARAGLIRGCSSVSSTYLYDWTGGRMSSVAPIRGPTLTTSGHGSSASGGGSTPSSRAAMRWK